MKRITLIFTLILSLTASCAFAAQRTITRVDTSITTGIAVDGNTIFFGDSMGSFTAVNASSGRQVWFVEGSDATAIGVPVVAGGKVFFAQVDGTITCLNTADGSILWQNASLTDENTGMNDGPAYGNGLIFAAKTDGKLYAINADSGQLVWTYKSEYDIRVAPAYANGQVFVAEFNGLFSMLDAKSGKRLNGGGAGSAINTPTVNGGNVYYSSWDGSIHAVQIKDVIPLWDAKVNEPITSKPVIGGGMLIIQTANGKVAAFSEKDGSQLWEYDSNGGDTEADPVFAGNNILAGTGDKRILVLDAKSGRLRNEFQVSQILNSNASGRIYFVNNNELCVME